MEFVYVVPREALFPDAYPHGVVPLVDDTQRAFERALEAGFFVERERAERTVEWKQIIPYSIVVRDGKVLLLKRLSAGGEARLHNKLSIGVGGHINPEDLVEPSAAPRASRSTGLLEAGTRRELNEELIIEGSTAIQRVGLLNDDSNAVGAVHVGLVQIVATDGPVSIRETDVLEGELVEPGELRRLRAEGANFETWSALLVDQLSELLPASPCTV